MIWSGFLVALLALTAVPAQAAPFDSIELRGGGTVTVRHGDVQRVTVISGDPSRDVRSEGGRLVIDPCIERCRHGHHLEVEIVTPAIGRLAVRDGGLIQIVGEFPAQPEVAAAVSDGGTIDIRRLEASAVAASVSQGGRILTRPARALRASVSSGGVVTYWGDAQVTSSIRHGGAVVRGAAGDLRASVAGLDPPLPVLPVLPRPPAPPRAPKN
jgi:hypothetical protein